MTHAEHSYNTYRVEISFVSLQYLVLISHCTPLKSVPITYRILVETSEVRDSLRDLGVNGRMILRSILNKWNGRRRLNDICFRIGTSDGLFLTL